MAGNHRTPLITTRLRDWFREDVEKPALALAGGFERAKVLVLLASVLGLDAADKATVGAVADQLKHALHAGNMEIGLLVTASTAIGAVATLPMGILVDRVHRVRLLVIGIVLWSAAMVVGGASGSYEMLLLTRLGLGAVIAIAAPAVASLTGDFFRPYERGRVYGYILTGELIGAGLGFMVSGDVAAVLSWRASFWVLASIGLAVAVAIWRYLPEPERGGMSPVYAGQREAGSGGGNEPQEPDESELEREIEDEHYAAYPALVLAEDPKRISWWRAFRYVLQIRSFVTLTVASALGYFYFTGIRTFGIVFVRGRFGLSQAAGTNILVGIGVGAIIGVLLAGRLSDWLIHKGLITGRIWTGAIALLFASGFFLPGLLVQSLAVAAPLFFIAGVGLGGTNPALDAARLDVMHHHLWGRAESVRATLRYIFEAIAPLLFGYVSMLFGGHNNFGYGHSTAYGAVGLDRALLFMLIALLAGGYIAFRGLRTYRRDVATAIESEHACRDSHTAR